MVIGFTSLFHEFRTQEHCALIFYWCNLLLLLGEFGVSDGGAVVNLWEWFVHFDYQPTLISPLRVQVAVCMQQRLQASKTLRRFLQVRLIDGSQTLGNFGSKCLDEISQRSNGH